MRKKEAGFTLIEIIASLLLIGLLSVFVGLFMTTLINSYFMVKNNAETALKAQLALTRMSLELRDVSAVSVLTDNTLIRYNNPIGANRTIRFVRPCIYLSTSTTNSILIDNLQTFTLNAAYANVYNIVANDVAYINAGFTINGYGSFNVKVFPRTRIPHP
jgi:prepilin-type N-terminal cleavage/methylation domain-containing protein